jgi:hypothetical protein
MGEIESSVYNKEVVMVKKDECGKIGARPTGTTFSLSTIKHSQKAGTWQLGKHGIDVPRRGEGVNGLEKIATLDCSLHHVSHLAILWNHHCDQPERNAREL